SMSSLARDDRPDSVRQPLQYALEGEPGIGESVQEENGIARVEAGLRYLEGDPGRQADTGEAHRRRRFQIERERVVIARVRRGADLVSCRRFDRHVQILR